MHVGAGEPCCLSLGAASRALQSFLLHQSLQNSTGDRHNLQCEGFPFNVVSLSLQAVCF